MLCDVFKKRRWKIIGREMVFLVVMIVRSITCIMFDRPTNWVDNLGHNQEIKKYPKSNIQLDLSRSYNLDHGSFHTLSRNVALRTAMNHIILSQCLGTGVGYLLPFRPLSAAF